MGKKCVWLLLTAILFLFSACGRKEQEVYYDIEAFSEQAFQEELPEGDFLCLGIQFYQGEPVQLLAERVKDEKLQPFLNIYLRRTDGSLEQLFEKLDVKYRVTGWFLDKKGNYYIPQSRGILKMDKTGQILWENSDGMTVRDICELDDGTIVLSVQDKNTVKLVRVNTETGEFDEMDRLALGENTFWLGAGKEGLYLMDSRGLWKVDLQEQRKEKEISFVGKAYSFTGDKAGDIWGFRVQEGNQVQTLRNGGIMESLKLVDVGRDKTILKIRMADSATWSWFLNQIVAFNGSNETYYVVLDQCSEEEDVWDFRTQTGVQLATGKGADIILGSAVLGEIGEYLKKGVFEDLKPYMERDGIREEEYFPVTFDCWREQGKIYGIQPMIILQGGFAIENSLVEGNTTPKLEELLDALLAYQEKAILTRYFNSEMLLEYFLEGSDTLWGSVDWEKGSCDFEGELFRKILSVSKQYGSKGEQDVPELTVSRNMGDLYSFDMAEDVEKNGRIVLGFFFDDGNHAWAVGNFVMAVNAASENKEGAWEFLSFLLNEAVQEEMDYRSHYPANREAFFEVVEREIEEGPVIQKINPDTGKVVGLINKGHSRAKCGYDNEKNHSQEELEELSWITKEKGEEVAKTIEDARPLPMRVEPILDIVCEEANDYFNDAKSMDEVIRIIENRVQLYLKEKN